MIASLCLLTPLVVLMIVLLFGFTGCQIVFPLDEVPQETYPLTIGNEPTLVAYWPLGAPDTTPVPSTGTALDQSSSHAHPGNFNVATITADAKRFSAAAPGTFTVGIKPGLLELTKPVDETKDPCIEVNGGFVEVPFDSLLNPVPFTIEAWIVPEFDATPDKNYYCLFESSAPEGGVQKKVGFGLYAGPENPSSAQVQPIRWQVWMGNGQAFQMVGMATDVVHFRQLTYLALTFDPGIPNNNLILFLYYPDTGQDLSMASVAPLQATVTNFKANNQAPGGSLLIGMGRNLFPGVVVDPVPLQPFLYAFPGKIQEVALYSSALDIAKLANHEMAGGNV
jgi:hypothetical protein